VGIVVRDVSLIYLFWQKGISKEVVLTNSLLLLIIVNVVTGLPGFCLDKNA
tara:strand:+ start:5567 stop:5719 length:153 start_codon:yes stop_codon:yes gene_type:complete